MQITIFGASGKVGSLVVEEALRRGHTVIAFTHSRDLFVPSNKMGVIKGDIHRAEDVQKALKSSDAVISTLGSWHSKSKDILSSAMKTIIPAMEAAGITRIVTLTGAGAFDEKDNPPAGQKIAHAVLGSFAGKILQDGEQHMRLLRASNLDWTVIRSPVMSSFGGEHYKLSSKLPKLFDLVPRKAVATALLDQLQSPEHVRDAPVIYRA